MGIVFRQSAKNAVVVALGAALGALTIWLSTRYTTKQQLGFTRTITTYAITFSVIVITGLNSTLTTYIHRYANDARKQRLLITFCLILPGIFLAALTIVYFFFGDKILSHCQPEDVPFMRQYFSWLPIFTLFFVYMTILEQYLGSQMKVAVSAFMREVVLRLAIIAFILLFGFGYITFATLVKGTILIYTLPVTIFALLSFKTKGFGLSYHVSDFSKGEYKDLAHFSWYHFLLSISLLMLSWMDQLLIPFYDHKGLSAMAIYGVAIFLISFLQLPLKALLPASFTVLAKAFAEEDAAKAKDIFVRSSINILIPSVAVAVLMCCNLTNVIAVIKNGYSEIIPVFLILFIGNMVNIATGMNDQVLSIAKFYKFNFYLSLLLMAALYIMIRLLVPRYGIYGAAWSTTSVLMVFNIVKCLFVWKKLDMQPFSISTVKILVAAAPALAAGYFFPYLFNPERHIYVHTFIDAFLRSSVILIVYGGMIIWLKPSKDLQEYLTSIKQNKRLF
jgi:O-antigen/teichoic acid export membrane protein